MSDACEQCRNGIRLRDVGRNDERREADLVGDLLEAFLAAASEYYSIVRAAERERDGATDPGTGASDESDFVHGLRSPHLCRSSIQRMSSGTSTGSMSRLTTSPC